MLVPQFTVGLRFGFTVIDNVAIVAHVGDAIELGVNVYVCVPTVLVLITDGDHVPDILLLDGVGNVPGVAF